MYLTRSEYDHGVSTFSPDGRLFQVEYAVSSIKLGSTAIGIQTAEGIVLAVEKASLVFFKKNYVDYLFCLVFFCLACDEQID